MTICKAKVIQGIVSFSLDLKHGSVGVFSTSLNNSIQLLNIHTVKKIDSCYLTVAVKHRIIFVRVSNSLGIITDS